MVNRLNHTKIDWAQYTWNPIHGCRHGCPYCYARRFAKRLAGRGSYPKEDAFQPIVDHDELLAPGWPRYPSRIFLGSMGDLFGNWGYTVAGKGGLTSTTLTNHEVIGEVVRQINQHTEHTFLVLTKNPAGIIKYEETHQLPKNLWLGVSVETEEVMGRITALRHAWHPNKFVSFEPLLADIAKEQWLDQHLDGIEWVIIGAQTGPGAKPVPQNWVMRILAACREKHIPIFIKNNVGWANPPQEFPRGFP